MLLNNFEATPRFSCHRVASHFRGLVVGVQGKMAAYLLGGERFTSKAKIKKRVQGILRKGVDGQFLKGADLSLVLDLLKMHPSYSIKKGCGIQAIKTVDHTGWSKHLGFSVVRTDGSEIDFSYRTCLEPWRSRHKADVTEALRKAVYPQVREFKRQAFAHEEKVWSSVDGRYLSKDESHVDHFPVPFADILDSFFSFHGLDYGAIEVEDLGVVRKIKDDSILEEWQRYHQSQAQYRIISAQKNVSLGRHLTRVQT